MTSGVIVRDPAVPVIGIVMDALADAYSPDSSFPPDQPTTTVRFFAGEGPATAAWDAHSNQTKCRTPFLWVRVMRRYRVKVLPNSEATSNACLLPRAIDVEIGVGRCAVVELKPKWEDYEAEAVTSLEDSWRVEAALCAAQARLRGANYVAAGSEIMPFGPEGGILGWSAVMYIQFD